ncbi:hypothetical protein AWC03_09855 [Mycobacterium europaeum]|uniref:DUF732 domain-containing protein n=1 Tax=Mycobacterium europaeum TaxID=761804 RepID=UPI000A16BED5|nr:DUF732 domain-containing protein [Mycobacterium europaeum]ORV61491.1 hypothetical protein AWC03_09855 [Mycobacterium europaeum]
MTDNAASDEAAAVPGDDETAAWDDDGAGGAETTIVPPVATEAAPELAWSLADSGDDEEVRPHESWRAALVAAAAIAVLCGIGAALITTLSRHESTDTELQGGTLGPVATKPAAALPPIATSPPVVDTPAAAPPTVTVTPAPPVTVTVQAPPPPAPAQAPAPRDADQIFREGVSGIPGIRIINWDVAEAGARSICGGFAHGMSRSQVVDEVQRNDPTFTPWQTSGMVNVALAAYCPQYEGN